MRRGIEQVFLKETTCEEERELRRFFHRGIVPEHLQMYRPMFAFLNEENRQSKTAVPEVRKLLSLYAAVYFTYSAEWLPEYCLYWVLPVSTDISTPPTANYVIIDGKCYTDAKLVREQAMIAFRDVSISEEEVFATLFSE